MPLHNRQDLGHACGHDAPHRRRKGRELFLVPGRVGRGAQGLGLDLTEQKTGTNHDGPSPSPSQPAHSKSTRGKGTEAAPRTQNIGKTQFNFQETGQQTVFLGCIDSKCKLERERSPMAWTKIGGWPRKWCWL